VLGVRNGHAPTDAGTTKLFTLHNRLDDAFYLAGGYFSRLQQRPDHLSNGALFVLGL